jgi:hypothetical protein
MSLHLGRNLFTINQPYFNCQFWDLKIGDYISGSGTPRLQNGVTFCEAHAKGGGDLDLKIVLETKSTEQEMVFRREVLL